MSFSETHRTDVAAPTIAGRRLTSPAPGSRVRTSARSRRDGLTALILGFFAAAWFSWGQAEASETLSTALDIGAATALVVAVVGAFRLCAAPRDDGALHDRSLDRRYGTIVGIEFALAGLGAVALGAGGASDYVPVWVCAVVGVHFFALAALFRTPTLRSLGAVVSAVSGAALLVGALTDVAPSSVTGAGAGLALLAYASLLLAKRVAGSVVRIER